MNNTILVNPMVNDVCRFSCHSDPHILHTSQSPSLRIPAAYGRPESPGKGGRKKGAGKVNYKDAPHINLPFSLFFVYRHNHLREL